MQGSSNTTRTSTNTNYAKIREGSSWFDQFRYGSNPWMARYVYALMFFIVNMLAWAVRDYGHVALKPLESLKGCKGVKECVGAEGALRVSLGCFIFYFVMFLSTLGTSKANQRRESWHSSWWFAKVTMMIALLVIPFFSPPEIISLYGDLAHFGAGVFLLIQLISVISFITWLNDCCQSEKNADRCYVHVMLIATTSYVVCLIGIIMMYIWYTPEGLSCRLNIFFITWTLVLIQLMTSVSRHPKINGGFLTPGLMGLYIVFLCWSAIRSEPPEDMCIRKAEKTTKEDWLTIISFVIAVLTIVVATFSTGIDSKCFQFRKDNDKEEDGLPYGYGFFHMVFATGAMYFAMLLISWNSHHSMKKWTIDVGWTSTWVRLVNEWLAVCIYIWMLVAPIIRKWKSNQMGESNV